ncbi:mucin-2-like isoform X2 [Crotalus tigris]|uniref:mucin-2-like isoform X2 n=1 Tax=Crotalus tigris TaxID=88082 RepID=UPI00192F1A34|nr:mucin-2-like isoform X2 [Crotalus tigris]
MNKVFFLLFFLFLCAETGGFSSDARNRLKYNESKKVLHIQWEVVQSEDERTQKDILDPKQLRENASEMTTEVTSKPASTSTFSEEAQVSPTMPSPTGNVVAVSTALTGTVSGESYTSLSHTSSTFSNVTTKASFFTSHSAATDTSASSHGPSAEPSTRTSDATTSIVSTSAPLGETHTPSTTLSTTGMEAGRGTASPSAPSERTDSPPPGKNPTGSDVGTTLATIWTTLVETHSPTMVHNHSTHMSPTPAHVATTTTSGNTPSGETHTSLITLDSTGRDITIDIALTTSLSPEIHTSSPRTLNDFVTSSMSTTSARQETSSSDTDLSPSASPSASASDVMSIPSTRAVSGEIHTSAKAPTAITNHVNSGTPSPSPLTVETPGFPIYSSPTITDVNKSTVFMTSSPGETQRSIANTGHTDNKGSTVMDPTDSPANQTRSPTENGSTPGTHVTATPAPTKTVSKETTSPSTEASSTLTDVSHQTALTSLSGEAYTPTSSGTTPEIETGTRTEVTSKPASASTSSEEAQVSPTMPSPTGNVVAVSTALTGTVSGESYTSLSHTSSTFSNVTTKASFFTSHSAATDTSASSHGPSADSSTRTSDATTSIVSTSAPLGETHTPSTTLSTTGMEASRGTASPSAPSERTDIPPPGTNPTGSDVGTTLATIWTTLVETHSPTMVYNHSTHMSPTPAHVATTTTSGNIPSGETHTSLITLDSTGRDVTIDIALTTSLSPEIHTSSPRTLNDFVTSSMSTTSARQETSSSDTDLSPSASPSASASDVTSIPSTRAVSGEIHTSAKAPTAITNHVNSGTPSPSPLTVETPGFPIYSSPTITDVNKSTVFMTSSPGETQRSIANTGHTDNKGSTVMDPTDSPANQTRSPTENGSTPGTHVTATPAPTKTVSKETTSPSTEASSTLTDVSHQTALTSLSGEAYTPTSSGTTPEIETGTRTEVTSKPASASTSSEEAQVSPTMPSPTGNVVAVSTALTGTVSGESYTSLSHTSSTFSNVTTKASFFTSHSAATDTSASSHGPSADSSTRTSDATTSIVSTSAPLGETHTPSTTLSTTGMEASRGTASPSAPSERTDIPPPGTNPTGSDVGTTLATIWTTLVETHSPTMVYNHSTHMSPTLAHVATTTISGNTPSGETHTSLITLDSTGRDVTIDIALTTSLSPEIHTSSPRTLNDFVTSSMSTTSARKETSSSDTDLNPSASPSASASDVTSIPSTRAVSGEIHTSAKASTAITNHVNSGTPSPSPLTVETPGFPIYSSPTITDVNKTTVFMTSSPGETQRSIANTGHTDNKGSTVMDPTDSPANQTQSPTENGSAPGTHVTATPAPTKTLSKETTSPSTEASSTLTDVSHQTALTSLSGEAYTPTSSGTTPENETGTRTEVTSKPASASTPSEEAQVSPTMASPTGNVVAVSTALTGTVSGESYTSLSHTSSTFSNVTTKASFFTSHSTATDNSASSHGPSAEPSTRTSDATTSIVSTSAPLGETHTPSTTLSTTGMEASRRTASPSAPSERTDSPPPSTNPTGSTPSAEAQVSPTMPNPTGNDVTVSTSLSGTLSVQSYTSSSYISIPFSNVTTSVTPSQEIPSPSAETSSPFTTKITIAESTSSASTTKTTTAKSTSSASTTKTTTAKSTIKTTTSELCHNGGTYDGTKCLCNEDLFYGPKCEFRIDEIPINELSVTITIEAQVRITNKEYKKSLEDLNSKYSQEIQAQFKKQMKDIYGAVPGYHGVEILRMRNGSIIVEHKVISQIEMKNNEETIQQNLNAVTGAVNHSLAGIHTDGECIETSGPKLCFDPLPNSTLIPSFSLKDTCKNISDSKYADYYYPHMMEGTVRCISRCFNGTQDSMNCYNGVCRLSEIGPYCSCNKSDMFWYLDSYCQLPVQKTALGLGLALAVLFVVSITLTVFLIRAKRKKSKNSWSADADTWYGEDADEEWIPSGSLNIMNKTAVSSWDKYQDRKKMVNLSPHPINTSLQKPTEFYHGTHPESSS